MSDSLTFRLLKYIKESAETLNFTRAAERVFVAQSSVSHQIGKLEENIDLVIFDRLQNGLKLTAAGRLIAAYAETTLRDWEQTLAMAHAVQRTVLDPSTQIRNGISEQSATEGEQVLNHFLNRLPIITLKEGSRARVYVGRDILIPSYAEHRVDPTL